MLNKNQEINLARHIFTPDDFRAFVDHVDGRETALEAHPDSRLARLASLMVHLGAVADTCPPPDPLALAEVARRYDPDLFRVLLRQWIAARKGGLHTSGGGSMQIDADYLTPQ